MRPSDVRHVENGALDTLDRETSAGEWSLEIENWNSLKWVLVGGFNHSENISKIGSSSQLLGKMKNVPNHQPVGLSQPLKNIEILSFFRVGLNDPLHL